MESHIIVRHQAIFLSCLLLFLYYLLLCATFQLSNIPLFAYTSDPWFVACYFCTCFCRMERYCEFESLRDKIVAQLCRILVAASLPRMP